MAGQTVASGVEVNQDGSFSATLTLGHVPGDYPVVASQNTSSGTLTASTTMMTVPNDNFGTNPPPPPT